MMGDMKAGGGRRAGDAAVAVALAIIVTALAAAALLGGPTLDDHWTIYLSDSTRGLAKLVEERWILDIRPPVFDAWATLLHMVGIDSIPLARLISSLPAVVLLVLAVRAFSRRLPDEAPFFAIFLLLVLSTPAAVRAFGVYRGDFWQLAAFAIQILLVRHVLFVQKDYRRKTDAVLALFALPATFAAITIDYGGALFGGIVAMATILAAIARGLRRWARSLLITVALAVATVIAMISWQAGAWAANFDLYQNWIEMSYGSAGAIIAALLFGTILHNPIALAGGYLGREQWSRGDTGFAIIIGAALVAALVAIMQIDAQRRLITFSNSSDVAVLVTALMATAGAKIADRRMWMNALAGVAILSVTVSATVNGSGSGWQSGAKRISRIVAACPQTQVFAVSGWRLDDGSASRAARREEPVFTIGYKRLARSYGFTAIVIPRDRPATAAPGRCPVLLWIERVPSKKRVKPAQVLKAAGLGGLEKARLSLIRGENGLIVRADR
ncbi:hypothetical protein HRJ34_02125 [Rhizorhabdus wittichii]|uniref:Uncharacterized protein n=1 Tax=Rhizorhabdus wittichii TaxID=160791 RepID=A0A975HEF0_9SPHN|nr:hypothetical protein [Rhizorhabdus wittichii]QTH22350.1 hypothetical protein HRJ34_02125 [Rhizorhabdus wittichii]